LGAGWSSQSDQLFAEKACDKVTLKVWAGMYHEIHNEFEQVEAFEVLLDWLEKH
jgi:alpha-beta hydrolase superfamily lysophospholipase